MVPSFAVKPNATRASEHEEVEPLRQPQAPRDAELDDQRAQPFPAIEIDILRRVNQVETGHPADHAGAENQRRQIEPAGLRDPGAGGRNRQGEAEKKMGRAREPFRQRVEER